MMPPRLPDAVEHLPLARLIPYARNARTHDDDQVAKIAASIVEFGWLNPVLIDDAGNVIAGHGRLLAAQKLGLDSIPVIRASHLTPAQVRAYRLLDNRMVELGGWNEELLAGELHALNGLGFGRCRGRSRQGRVARRTAALGSRPWPGRGWALGLLAIKLCSGLIDGSLLDAGRKWLTNGNGGKK